jgi:hypothetical protein
MAACFREAAAVSRHEIGEIAANESELERFRESPRASDALGMSA